MTHTALEHLTDADWALLRDRARRRTFSRGETILRQDDAHLALFVIHRGFARVERNEQGSGIAISSLGPGEIFGEMSFLEGTGASASVVADDAVEVDMIDGSAVQSLLVSDPGLSARFYRSLALSLSSRLRRASRDLAHLRVSDVPNGGQRPTVRTGHVQERQIPPELVEAVHDFREHIQEAVANFARRETDEETAQATVGTSCNVMLRVLARLTDYEALVAAGIDDPFSFRDPGELEAGYGAFVFREAFPIFMASATLARCQAKPRGHPDDWETLMRIHRDEPEGEGRLGVLVDRWFLSRPICRTIRASRDWMASLLVAAVDEAGGSISITSASSKAGSELLDAMAARPGSIRATCLDGDSSALREASRLARRLGVEADVSFLNANVVRIAAGEAPLRLPEQQLVYALGLFEYLDDLQVVSVLDWAHATLGAGGVFVGTNPVAPGIDRVLAEHILEWPMIYRSDEALRGLVERSAFGRNAQLEIALDEAQGTWFLRCVRP